MAEVILKDCEFWFAKLDPKRPDATFNHDNPTWEVQIRTTSKATKSDWQSKGLTIKAQVPDEGEPYFYVNLRRRSLKADKVTPNTPVIVMDGKLAPIAGGTVGHGSTGNVKLYQYPSKADTAKEGDVTSILVAVQLTKLIMYVQKFSEPSDGFEKTDTEFVRPKDDGSFDSSVGNDQDEASDGIVSTGKTKSAGPIDDFDDDIPF